VGWVRLSRLHFVCIACRDSAQPLDDRLGLADSLTETARRLLSLAGASWSFGSASRHVKSFCGLDASGEFIRRVAESAGKKVAVWMDESPAAAEPFATTSGEAEFETDGTAVNTLQGWKETKIGIFAKRERGESVETNRWADRTLPAPTARFAFARIAESTAFAASWGPTAKRLGLDPRAGGITVLGDGAEWIWNRAEEQFPGSPQVLDIFHALKYVGDGAKAVFGDGTPEAAKHSDRGRDWLLADGYAGVESWVGEMLGAEPKGGDGADLGGILNYLKGHEERLNYALRLKRGQSIGTGMVEGAAKNLIGRRLKANSARWCLENVGKMAGLCSALYSDCWDAFWVEN
jgi:hypothetical protein